MNNLTSALNGIRRLFQVVAIVAGLSFAAYLPFCLQQGKLKQPSMTVAHHTPAATITPTKSGLTPTVAQHGQAAWAYDFSKQPDGVLSRKDWNFATGTTIPDYNSELEAYTARASNARVQDGQLVLEAQPEQLDGKPYTSARIDTKGVFDFTYGTINVDAKLPAGAGSWPAAWLVPADNVYNPANYGIAPSNPYGWALNGEIDFLEAIGSIPGQNIPAIHSFNEVQRAPTYTPAYIPDSATAFHDYGVIKTPTSITFTIDGKPYATRTKTSSSPLEWPYDQPYYLILDLAVGGKWAGADGIDTTTAPWQLQVKSITYTPLF